MGGENTDRGAWDADGANPDVYAERKQLHADRTYLTGASAAILWKHPSFSGTAKGHQHQPTVKLVDYKPTYGKSSNRITLAGKVVSDMPTHCVVVLDDLGKPAGESWHRGHVARVEPDGSFRVAVDRPARADGHFRIMFCFENGMVTGDGAGSSTATRARSARRTASATAATSSGIDRRPGGRGTRRRGHSGR